jgi:predicted TIM-barrel fold metal-dependent hydrolase
LSLPATALAGPERLDGIGGVLERASVRGVPVFVHPGASEVPAGGLSEPLWWRALTDYVSQMQAAWLTFAAFGRREHPELRIVFAMLAGGGPLLAERLATRGGPPIELADPLVFYDSSSYGPDAVEAMAERVGIDQLVYGSDRPVVEPLPTPLDEQLAANGGRLVTLGSAV